MAKILAKLAKVLAKLAKLLAKLAKLLEDIRTAKKEVVMVINSYEAEPLKELLDKVTKYDVDIIYLPSTSPANARMGVDVLVTHYQHLFE